MKEWYVRTEEGDVYGPASVESLTAWAEDGRIAPSSFVSKDRIEWMPAQRMDELEMKWLVETEPGKIFGPFNRKVVSALYADGSVPAGAKAYRLHEFAIDEDAPAVEKIVEKVVEKEVRVEVPVEKIVEKIVDLAHIITAEDSFFELFILNFLRCILMESSNIQNLKYCEKKEKCIRVLPVTRFSILKRNKIKI